jgi:hypothetical protein
MRISLSTVSYTIINRLSKITENDADEDIEEFCPYNKEESEEQQ